MRSVRFCDRDYHMFTVALIGPDGAGKTTMCRRLERTLPLAAKYLYMGVSRDSSNHMLPTTRLIRAIKRALGAPPDTAGPPDPARVKPRPKGLFRRAAAAMRAALRLVNQLSEEWFRQALVWYYRRRGYVVLFDRHFFVDYYDYDVVDRGTPRPLSRRIHGFMLDHVYPKPDLVIYLDAPAEVLFARKGEGTVEALERRRGDYARLCDVVEQFVTVDATGTKDEVEREVTRLICEFYQNRIGKLVQLQDVTL